MNAKIHLITILLSLGVSGIAQENKAFTPRNYYGVKFEPKATVLHGSVKIAKRVCFRAAVDIYSSCVRSGAACLLCLISRVSWK
jgi:hypothetical protein